MAHLHTDLPSEKHRGERQLARQLSAVPDDELHLWFGLDCVPGVGDIDILIWHEAAGVFVVEVKAVPLKAVRRFGWGRCEIEGRGDGKSPQLQASSARDSLRDFLVREFRGTGVQPPFIMATVCWPRITREEWDGRWTDEKLVGDFAETMLFVDDLTGGEDALRARLDHIWQHPPNKRGSNRPFAHDGSRLSKLADSLVAEETAKPAPSDYERLRQIEQTKAAAALKEVPIGAGTEVLYRGYPGTGKTFRLLQIGLAHALEGRRVLFSCFNKVLAADVTRLLSLSSQLDAVEHCFDVSDVYQLLSQYAGLMEIAVEVDEYDDWGEEITRELVEREKEHPLYDLVLVDESQDMRDWALRMLELHRAPGGSICVAFGSGQELYGNSQKWIDTFAQTATTRQLRRNFRNTRQVFQLAHVFYETALDSEKIRRAVRRFRKSGEDNQLPLFDRPRGNLPIALDIDDDHLPWSEAGSPWFPDQQAELMVPRYKEIFELQLEELSERERPIDVLILVPSEKSVERKWARDALGLAGIDYMDYTDPDCRRQIAPSDAVRLCTYHSARGLEGYRVVVLGFEKIERLAESVATDMRHLGYTVLSRSVFETVIIKRRSRADAAPMRFLSDTLNVMRGLPI